VMMKYSHDEDTVFLKSMLHLVGLHSYAAL
jgi:hypothetical protein